MIINKKQAIVWGFDNSSPACRRRGCSCKSFDKIHINLKESSTTFDDSLTRVVPIEDIFGIYEDNSFCPQIKVCVPKRSVEDSEFNNTLNEIGTALNAHNLTVELYIYVMDDALYDSLILDDPNNFSSTLASRLAVYHISTFGTNTSYAIN